MMNEITYRQAGDFLIPNIELTPTENKPLGKYGRMRRAYLKEHNPMLLNDLILSEQLFPHLWEIDETAHRRVEQLMTELLEQNPAPDKATQQMAWVQHKLLKYFPAEIERQQGYIQGFEADVQTVVANPQIADGFCGMELLGKHYTEKADAGEMILAACKEVKSTEPVSLGTYRGFNMELSFDSFRHEFDVILKGAMSHRVALGTDARGNITRLDNALAAVPDRLEKAREQLTNLQNQQEATRAELGKPFPQEAELAQKSARLAELDAELNMDDKSTTEQTEERPSVLADLKSKSERIPPARRSEEKEEVL